MGVKLSPIGNDAPFVDANGNPLSGGKLYTYQAGSSTPATTYQDSAGSTPNANPIILSSAGYPASGGSVVAVWLTESQAYKFVLKDSSDVTIWTRDNVSGINDATTTIDEYAASGLTPTYVSASSFTVPGDQTTELHVGRRLKITDAGGTKYATITASSFGASTTVTVSVDDAGSLSSPLSALSWALLRATNASLPRSVLSPSQITANQNDYNPSGLSGAQILRISSDARRNVTGLQGGSAGRRLTIHNVGTFPIPFKYEDSNSSAANRFAFGHTLGGGQSMEIQYDSTSSRWRALHKPEEIGTIKDFGTSTMPEGFLAIDQNVSRTTYAALFNEVGTTWGSGDGSTTFGLYVGAGAALIAAGTGTQSDAGGNADVDTTNDTLTVPSNNTKWITGMLVTFTLSSGTVTGLTSGNPYYVIRASSTTVKLASSLANAQNGTAIDFTAKSSPVWTITHTYTARTHGERLGEESHAQSLTELIAHNHPYTTGTNTGATSANNWHNSGTPGGVNTTSSTNTGGNAAMPNMQPSSVVTRGVRYC